MKKVFKAISMICVFTLLISVTAIYANEEPQPSKEEMIEQFNNLQNKIDHVLEIKNNKYVFNKKDVIEVVKQSKFNFALYNEYFNTKYTKESFTTIAIDMIEDTDLSYKGEESNTCSVYGTFCGKNGTSSGWNYNRFYRNKSNSNHAALGLDALARNWSLLASVGTLAAVIRSNNSDGNCGTVTDINKFTTVFSVWSQREFIL